MADKFLRGFYRTGLAVFGQNRHKRLRKRAFGKNAPQQIGQFKSHKKGIGGHACAKSARNNGVAHKAEDARQHGHAADFGQRAEQIHGNRLPETQTGYSIPIYANNLTAPAATKKGCLKVKLNLSGSLR